jgi:Carboxypeptidase regulatory-like domain
MRRLFNRYLAASPRLLSAAEARSHPAVRHWHRTEALVGLHRVERRRMIDGRIALPSTVGATRMRRVLASLLGVGVVFVWASVGHAPRPAGPAEPVRGALVAATPLGTGAQETPEQSKPSDQRVRGKVVDRDGKAVDKAEVKFDGPKKGKVWTNSAGEFSFTGPPGDYVITVKAGDRHQDFKVKIADNQLEPSTLILEPKPVA